MVDCIRHKGELDADLYTSYYGPTDEVTRDDLA
ncbi:hypothetical protein M6B38_251875 [Iris pallida]|uniref:Ribulose-1,5-bisphosphate carboxylase/oxygenase large subunit n=1 Tax=Iris pallida TaxID=29817 RepID=A0AAX6HRR4_IRIPA|nr:hypothetical protein M6B38_300760 [Iris pallida]KAJ6853046.1 hypothetical protein M6B38_251875 [Iris pallida]